MVEMKISQDEKTFYFFLISIDMGYENFLKEKYN